MNQTEIQRASVLAEPPPALTVVVHRAHALLAQREAGLGELAALVEIDAALTGAMVRVVRSPIHGVACDVASTETCLVLA